MNWLEYDGSGPLRPHDPDTLPPPFACVSISGPCCNKRCDLWSIGFEGGYVVDIEAGFMRCENAPGRAGWLWFWEEMDAVPAATEAYEDRRGINPVLVRGG